MLIPRILEAAHRGREEAAHGARLLDGLRYWVAVPLGAAAGAWLGFRIAQPGVGGDDVLLAAVALVLISGLGLSSPRPVSATGNEPEVARAPSRRQRVPSRGERGHSRGERAHSRDRGLHTHKKAHP